MKKNICAGNSCIVNIEIHTFINLQINLILIRYSGKCLRFKQWECSLWKSNSQLEAGIFTPNQWENTIWSEPSRDIQKIKQKIKRDKKDIEIKLMGLRVLRVIWVVHLLLWHIRISWSELVCCKQFNKYCKQSKNISEMGLWISRSMNDFDLLLIYRVIYNLYSISSKEFRLWKR